MASTQVATSKSRSSHVIRENVWHLVVLTKNQFPDCQGLQPTPLYQSWGFNAINKAKDFIQPIHAGYEHCVVLTNIGLHEKEWNTTVILYDSLISLHPNPRSKYFERPAISWQVAQLLRPSLPGKKQSFYVKVKPCMQQANGWDCGIFCIVHCVSLVLGKRSEKVVYDGSIRHQFDDMVKHRKHHRKSDTKRFRCRGSFKKIDRMVEISEMLYTFETICQSDASNLGQLNILWELQTSFSSKMFHSEKW